MLPNCNVHRFSAALPTADVPGKMVLSGTSAEARLQRTCCWATDRRGQPGGTSLHRHLPADQALITRLMMRQHS
jgi:hypothetical protein